MAQNFHPESPVLILNGFEESHESHETTSFSTIHPLEAAPIKQTIKQRLQRLRWWFSFAKAKQELCDPLFWHDVINETVLCVFFNAMIVWVGITLNGDVYRPSILHFGIFAGFFVFVCIEGWGPLCGASINCARTFSVFLCGKYSPIRSLIYFLVEVGGGPAGAALAKSMTPTMYHDRFRAILPAEGMTGFQACFMEAILTANLMVICLVFGDPKLKPNSVMIGFPVGFTVATGIMATGTHTVGLCNPVIALVYAINGKDFTDHWIYWVGSLVGSAIGTLFFVCMEQIRNRFGPYSQPQVHESPYDGLSNISIHH